MLYYSNLYLYLYLVAWLYNNLMLCCSCCVRCCLFGGVWWNACSLVKCWDGMHDCVWTRAVFIVWNLLEDTAQLQPWPRSLAYCQEVKGIRIGLNLCSKTVSWADVLFAYSCTATSSLLVCLVPVLSYQKYSFCFCIGLLYLVVFWSIGQIGVNL